MPNKGYKQTPEHIARNRASRGPVVISEEQRRKTSAALTGRRYNVHRAPVKMPRRTMETAWAAGLFEGEGCITVNARRARLQLASTDRDVLERFLAAVCVGKIQGPYQQRPTSKPIWHWVVYREAEIRMVVALFWPFLGSRRRGRWGEVKVASGWD